MLLDLGVTSLSVSLDGASEATNDALRVGGRFDAIVRNIGGVIRLREQRGADLRVGISTVVTAANVGELPRLGRLARDLGVDWIEVEEISPCTLVARSLMIRAREAPADDFANRTTFQPCRMEWEQAAIDPDGTVHPADYGGPPIGNLASASFVDLWNGEAMRAIRRAALGRTRTAQRRGCGLG